MNAEGTRSAKSISTGWASPKKIEVVEQSPDRLKIKYRYHMISKYLTLFLLALGIFFIGAGVIVIVIGIEELSPVAFFIGGLVLSLMWIYPRQCRMIVVDKKSNEISFSDWVFLANRIPLNVSIDLVKGLTIATEIMASKPEHLLSITLKPVPQGPFSIGHFTHLLVKSYDASEIEELTGIISEFSGIPVIRQS
ncbi:MAG: hypothetical protein GYA24_17125 [Candidatus Lokiarchaeota archaeon]|nr:hypothetical protein [Candidatus Lokiarchaeota archaeon]